MKKSFIFITLLSLFVLSSCGVGSYSVSGGVEDQAALSFSSQQRKTKVLVDVDGVKYHVEAVYHKNFKKMRDIKKTSENTITVTPGKHQVMVYSLKDKKTPIVSKTIILSVGDHRIIEL